MEITWVPYLDGSGYLVGAYTRHRLLPLRVFAHVDPSSFVILRVSRRAAREAVRRIEDGEIARLSYREWSLTFTPESPIVAVVSNNDGHVTRRIYRTAIAGALRPLL
jgi:hypothetical protein